MTRRKWLFALISFLVMLGVSAWLVLRHWPSSGMPWLHWTVHAAVLSTVIAEILSRAFKMKASAQACGIELGYLTALRACLAGDFAAAVTPARAGAEPARFVVLAESGASASGRVLILFLELFLEMCSLAVLSAILIVLFKGSGTSAAGLLSLVGGYSVFVLAIGSVGVILATRSPDLPAPEWLQRMGITTARWERVRSTLEGIRSSVKALKHAHPGRMALAFGASVLHIVFKMSVLPLLVLLGDSAFEINAGSLAPLVLWPLALFYGGVAIPAPGGGGVVEGAFAATLAGAIPEHLFAAALIWWRFYTYYLYIILGALGAGHATMRALSGEPRHAGASSDDGASAATL